MKETSDALLTQVDEARAPKFFCYATTARGFDGCPRPFGWPQAERIRLNVPRKADFFCERMEDTWYCVKTSGQDSWSVVRRPSSVVRRPSSVVRRPSSVARRPSSVARRPSSVVRRPSPVVRRPSSVVCRLSSSVVVICFFVV